MDPLITMFADNGKFGVILYVLWKLAQRVLIVWKENTKDQTSLELKRLDQQHDQHTLLSQSINGLSHSVHENTAANVRQLEGIESLVIETRETNRRIGRLGEFTPPEGLHVQRRP